MRLRDGPQDTSKAETFTVPISESASMSARPHLLLVDDEAAIREPLGQYLQRAGFRVSEAGNAADARKILAGSAIELVVLDIMMPGEDGLSLCRSIREQGELPVILLTARTEETDRIVGLEMGADDYVLKPFSPRELVARIKTILRRAGNGTARETQASASLYRFEGWTLSADDWTLSGPPSIARSTTRSAACAASWRTTPARRRSSRPCGAAATCSRLTWHANDRDAAHLHGLVATEDAGGADHIGGRGLAVCRSAHRLRFLLCDAAQPVGDDCGCAGRDSHSRSA